jgi:hypothetical protein
METKMRYQVNDETGAMLRRFYTKEEALAFMQKGWTLIVLPKKPKPDLIKLVGEAPF